MQKNIDIKTTQNVTIEYELASLRERMLAWLLDTVIILFGYGVLVFVVTLLTGGAAFDNMGLAMLIGLLPFILFFIYHSAFEIWNLGQTLGKKALNIRVVRLDGKDPEWSDVILRAFLQIVDTIFSSGVIGAVLIKTTPKSQRLGDMAANTTVIKLFNSRYQFRLTDILSIATLENYQPVYPQVRRLGEQDMLFVKQMLTRYQRYPNDAHLYAMEDLITHLMPLLDIERRPMNSVEFLKTLLRDYVVLTR